MHKLIIAIIRHERIDQVTSALKEKNISFMFSEVKGFCKETHLYHKDIQNRIRIEVHAKEAEVEKLTNIIFTNACCGLEEDGCLSILNLEEFINFSEYE